MAKRKNKFSLIKSWLQAIKSFRLPLLIWLNVLTIVVLVLLGIYAHIRSKGDNVANLFSDPFNVGIFYLGWFTGISEILWCATIAICIFTASLLPKINRHCRIFLVISALLMSWLYFDDRFRLTLILCAFFGVCKLVKTTIYLIYGSLLIIYGITFSKLIKKTAYIPLVIAFLMFGFSSIVDITPLSSRGIHAMLEDGTKLIGLINLFVYFWYVCQYELKKYLNMIS